MFCCQKGGWCFSKRKHGVSISFRKTEDEECKLDCFRGAGVLPFAPNVLCDEIMREGSREWDPQLVLSKTVCTLDDQTLIMHHVYRAKKCLIEIHRDFVFVLHKRVLGLYSQFSQ
jgi:hypothetical protein